MRKTSPDNTVTGFADSEVACFKPSLVTTMSSSSWTALSSAVAIFVSAVDDSKKVAMSLFIRVREGGVALVVRLICYNITFLTAKKWHQLVMLSVIN
ncbi:hypothetical protein CRENPOLYSF2_280003 [Crenothrix polyspora]|uniref:Uncharacterized protein n=1 Tax=Crenothrix polyspora TaxID=360316 RepID=A0A1R4H9T1_9GAMM|nr:hypothetical protein CRENPOLYSF2_280003 [Crenothrix polyspora]